MKKTFVLLTAFVLCLSTMAEAKTKWISLFNGKDLSGWFVRGNATWKVQDGVLVGEGGMGHIYTDVSCKDFEMKGIFRITEQGATSNSGLYFRCNPPADDPDGFPNGYEAQICHNQDASTGWLWLPGNPIVKPSGVQTKDGEWFEYHIKMVGTHMEFRINGKLVLTYEGDEYKSGHFAIQGHNPGMKIEAKNLFYRNLDSNR